MTVKMPLGLLLLLTSLAGVSPRRPREIYVKAGEMVALQCPHNRGQIHPDVKLSWTSYTTEEMDLTNMSSAELRRMGVVAQEWSLVILSASVNHQGNYLCSQGNTSKQTWFILTVYTPQSENEERTTYSQTCYAQESCTLSCPDVNIPAVNSPNITSNGIIWHKVGESLPKDTHFSNMEENDHGVYTCTRSYLYQGQIFNMTFTVVLDVKPKKKTGLSEILLPHNNDVFHVDLGSAVVIDCEAVVYSSFDEVFWLSGNSFVEVDENSPVFYNLTWENNNHDIMSKMTASLVFKSMSEEDLSKNYTCKLESTLQSSSFVTITLAQKASSFSLFLTLGIVGIMVIIATVVVFVTLKIDITLFLQDRLGCCRSPSDGKSYDAFLMCYKSNTDTGLNEDDRKFLESVLEEKFGYSLCLYDRDILPGKAVVEAVLDCTEQSHTVVLVPTSSDPGLQSSLFTDIHESFVAWQTRLVFIKTEATEVSRSGSLPEALQLLADAGDCVTWKGVSSVPLTSSFWKQLRYYLPAPQRSQRTRLLPQATTLHDNC